MHQSSFTGIVVERVTNHHRMHYSPDFVRTTNETREVRILVVAFFSVYVLKDVVTLNSRWRR